MKALNKICVIFALVSIMASSPSLCNDYTQFDFLGFIKAAYDAYNKVKNLLEPEPNLADLIEQAKQEILYEINLVRAEEEIANVEALIEQYVLYLKYPPTQQTIEAWIRDAINASNQFEILIQNKSPRIAYLCARSYNMLIPIMALMMQRYGYLTEDILPQFNDAIATNQALIGPYCWDELPNVPLYWNIVYANGDYVGKLLKCYREGIIDWTEYLTIYDIVWSGNEEMRKNIIERYEDVWFYISNERAFPGQPVTPNDNKHLWAHARSNRTEAKVGVAYRHADDTDFLWRLEFLSPRKAKILHWSGKYLAVASDKKNVIVTSRPDWDNEFWSFQYHYFFPECDRVTITANIDSGYWLTASGDSATVSETSFGPSVLGYQSWVIHYAQRRAMGIGYSAFPCPADYDGDHKADLGLKLNDGRWLIDFASNNFGNWDREITTLTSPAIDKYAQPAAADYDGDGKADIAVKHDLTGQWCIDYAANGYGNWDVRLPYGPAALFYSFNPVPADYDGDGKADVAIFVNTGRWSIDYSANGFTGWEIHPHAWEVYYPKADIYPAPADYDGNGKADISIKLDDGRWLFDLAYNGFAQKNEWDLITATAVNYGDITAHPVPGSYWWNSWYNHLADLAVWTESGRWMIDSYLAVGVTPIDWTSGAIYGSKNSFPIPADYDGDGMMDLSVVQEDGTWSIDFSTNGYHGWDRSSTLSIPTSVASRQQQPNRSDSRSREFTLSNYPNPFNSTTSIHYDVTRSGPITIKIYNVIGAEIATLVNETKTVGKYSITWDGRDKFGREMPAGIYLCQMVTPNIVGTNKMLLVK